MNPFDFYKNALTQNYANFSGRARRSEYWYFTLFNLIVSIALSAVDITTGYPVLSPIYSLAVLIPTLAVGIRRLHDIGKSGWWVLIACIPIVGAVVLFVFLVTDSQVGENQYGLNPKEQPEYDLGDHLVGE